MKGKYINHKKNIKKDIPQEQILHIQQINKLEANTDKYIPSYIKRAQERKIKEIEEQYIKDSPESIFDPPDKEIKLFMEHLSCLEAEEKQEFVENFIYSDKLVNINFSKIDSKTVRELIDEIFPIVMQIELTDFVGYFFIILFIAPLKRDLTSEEIYQILAAHIKHIDINWIKKYYDYLLNEQQLESLIFLSTLTN